MNNKLITEAHSAARKRLIAYARQTGMVTCAMVARAWQLGMDSDDALYAAAGAGIAERHLQIGNGGAQTLDPEHGFGRQLAELPRAFFEGYNAAITYGKLNAALEG